MAGIPSLPLNLAQMPKSPKPTAPPWSERCIDFRVPRDHPESHLCANIAATDPVTTRGPVSLQPFIILKCAHRPVVTGLQSKRKQRGKLKKKKKYMYTFTAEKDEADDHEKGVEDLKT